MSGEVEGLRAAIERLRSACTYMRGFHSASTTAVRTDDLLLALSALTAARDEGWRPIGEAPRDGTEVLIFDGHVVTAESNPHGVWFRTNRGAPIFDGISLVQVKATHFRPLPAPPTTGGVGQ